MLFAAWQFGLQGTQMVTKDGFEPSNGVLGQHLVARSRLHASPGVEVDPTVRGHEFLEQPGGELRGGAGGRDAQ
ncbi:hypothetical protein ACFVHB_09190 [Kitasatospora sp. NPDC127111]|uniref:hypothetical protein n=1 Tax=Kitasatospora sp. NPDC127111 TaxID=3345363 RepID=UPI00362DF48D